MPVPTTASMTGRGRRDVGVGLNPFEDLFGESRFARGYLKFGRSGNALDRLLESFEDGRCSPHAWRRRRRRRGTIPRTVSMERSACRTGRAS